MTEIETVMVAEEEEVVVAVIAMTIGTQAEHVSSLQKKKSLLTHSSSSSLGMTIVAEVRQTQETVREMIGAITALVRTRRRKRKMRNVILLLFAFFVTALFTISSVKLFFPLSYDFGGLVAKRRKSSTRRSMSLSAGCDSLSRPIPF